jgi:hypothetical protein
VTINQARGVVDARSTSGHVNVRGRDLKETRLSSVSGQVSFEGRLRAMAVSKRNRPAVHIELRMPESFGAEYDLQPLAVVSTMSSDRVRHAAAVAVAHASNS